MGLGTIQALTMAAGLARTKVLATMLGPAGVGVASVIDQVVSLAAQVGSVSIPFAALTFLSRLAAPDDARERVRAYAALFTAILLFSTAVAGVAAIVAGWRPTVFSDGLDAFRFTLLVAICGVPPFAMVPFLRNVMAALERHRDAALATFFTALATVVASYVGVAAGGLTGLFAANGAVSLATVVALQFYVARRIDAPVVSVVRPAVAAGIIAQQPGLVRFAAALYLLAFTSPVAYLSARGTLLSTHGATAAGLAAAAYGIAVSVRLVLHQANTLYLLPLVNREPDTRARIAIVAEYLRVLMFVATLSVLVIALFPDLAIRLLYSERFLGAVPVVTTFLIAEATLLLAGVYQSLLVGLDDTWGLLAVTAAGHVAAIVLARLLVPPLGAHGVGLAFVVGNAIILTAGAARLRARHGARRLIAPLIALTVVFAVVAAISSRVAGPGLALAWRVTVLAVGVCIGFALLRPPERRWLLSIGRRPRSAAPPD